LVTYWKEMEVGVVALTTRWTAAAPFELSLFNLRVKKWRMESGERRSVSTARERFFTAEAFDPEMSSLGKFESISAAIVGGVACTEDVHDLERMVVPRVRLRRGA
jgi:hypothetical protein